MTQQPISTQIRENRSVLAQLEKEALLFLAERLPRRVNSDHLTLLALAAMLACGVFYAMARWNENFLLLVPVALAANWFGDSLDGTVARVRNCQRPRYGFYVDHVIDVVGLLLLLAGLAVSGFMNPFIALGLFAAYVLVAAEVFLATCVQGVFRLSVFGFGPTELRIVLAVGTLFLLYRPTAHVPLLGPCLLFDIGAIVTIAGMGIAFAVSVLRNSLDLYRAEPLPAVQGGEIRDAA